MRSALRGTPRLASHGGAHGTGDAGLTIHADFSTGVNAYGPAPVVARAVRDADPSAYPDPISIRARTAVARAIGRPPREIAVGAGSTELFYAVCRAVVGAGDTVLVPQPGFGEYARAATLAGADVVPARPGRREAREHGTPAAFIRGMRRYAPRLVVLCTPENPSGAAWPREAVTLLADECRRAGAILVLDQAYDVFQEEPLGLPALPGHSSVLHLRSLTKEHALAGVRVGLAVGPTRLIETTERARHAWATSTAAQAATIAAFSDEAARHVADSVTRLRASARDLAIAFAHRDIPTMPTQTHFFLARVGKASAFARRLLEDHGLKVRDASSFGLPDCVRIAARTTAENLRLVGAIAGPSPATPHRSPKHVRSH